MSTEGTIPFEVGGETYRTAYKFFGDLKTPTKRPIVLLHGGPGMSHHYLLSYKLLYEEAAYFFFSACKENIGFTHATVSSVPVVLYDQIGGGASSHRPDAPTEFWVPELFMDELDNLIEALGIHDNFDLLGHSWGGMLAAHYAASRTPKGLKRLILANCPASAALNSQGTDALLSTYSKEYVTMKRKHEAEGTVDCEEYQNGAMLFAKKHSCTVEPWPSELIQSYDAAKSDTTVCRAMLGPNQFQTTGNLKDWDIREILHNITSPTLLVSAPLDLIQEVGVLPFFNEIPKVKWVELQNSTHQAHYEEPERYFKVILEFLDNTEPVS